MEEPLTGVPVPASRLPPGVAEQVADAMFALATPSRVQILRVLMDGPCGVGDLTEFLGMEQSAVSHQLRILREHGMISAERIGRRRVYALRDEHVTMFFRAALRHIQHDEGLDSPSDRRRGAGSA